MVDLKNSHLELEAKNENALSEMAKKLIVFGEKYNLWLLDGQMGAGKTTFTKAICKEFGVIDVVNSPTFSIVNEYEGRNGEVFYHFDFYRIKNENEAVDIGLDEYLYSGNYCFIEWSSRIYSLLPPKYLKIDIEITGNESRLIKCTKYG